MLHALYLQNDLAELQAGLKIGVRRSRFVERHDAINDRLQTPGSDKFQHRMQFRFCAHVRAKKRKLAAEEKPQVDLDVVAGGSAASDQTPAKSKTRNAFVPSGGANMFEDNIDTTLIRDAANFFADFLRFVVDDVVGAKLLRFFQLRIGSRSSNDSRSKKLGTLPP